MALTTNGIGAMMLLALTAVGGSEPTPLPSAAKTSSLQAFVHPGLLQSKEDLERMKRGLAAKDPVITSAFEVFRKDRFSQSTYSMKGPGETIGRAPSVNFGEFNDDAAAAYQNALMWCLTGDAAHATKAKEIVNAWGAKLQRVTGRDGVLMAGLGPFELVNAAELLRYAGAGWAEADIQQCERMFTHAIYPEIKDFALFANGNWDAAAEQTMFGIAVFCNDRAMLERALRYYCKGGGNGRITHYVVNDTGQVQESGRDQQHTQLGLGLLADCCEVAWHQGLDLYGYADNRLLKGFEYTAEYLDGGAVPFVPMIDRTGKYPWEKISPRSGFRPVYEQIYNDYVQRAGLSAPKVEKAVLERLRPEGPMNNHDSTGFGTLLYARPKAASRNPLAAPVAPGAIVCVGSTEKIRLTWVSSIGAESYTVKRSSVSGGPYAVIAQDVKTNSYTDASVRAGTVYYYVATARNSVGESADAWETGASAGPPAPWAQRDIGAVSGKGFTEFDGRTFTLDGGGAGFGGTNDQGQFAWRPLHGDGTIVARFVPQMSGALSSVGLMMRESVDIGSPQISLLINAQNRRNAESAGYTMQLDTRAVTGAAATIAAESPRLGEPYSQDGRMLGYCWLRLQRAGQHFTASYSPDGNSWIQLPETSLSLKPDLLIGLAVSSTQTRITSTAMFDNVTVSN